jgi:hypothetical protein
MTGVPFQQWDAFAATILEATRLQPSTMLPLFAMLVVRRSDVVTDERITEHFDFDPKTAERLFGSVDTILDLFEGLNPQQWAEIEPVQAVFRAVVKRRDARSVDAKPDS